MVKDLYNKNWITEKSVGVLREYSSGITLRQLYYRLVAQGMTNDINHYKRVIKAMVDARWEGVVDFNAFIDRERSMEGSTEASPTDLDREIERAKNSIKIWMEYYNKHRWENQEKYIEVWIEKKALQGVFENSCHNVGLGPCKGYPSLTFLREAKTRFSGIQEMGKEVIMLYFGDYDPSGEDIPRSIKENLSRMGCDIIVERIALNQDQIDEMGLPSVPAKSTDTRSKTWEGEGVVELDAVEPRTLARICKEAIERHFDQDKYQELNDQEEDEKKIYKRKLKQYINTLR